MALGYAAAGSAGTAHPAMLVWQCRKQIPQAGWSWQWRHPSAGAGVYLRHYRDWRPVFDRPGSCPIRANASKTQARSPSVLE